MKWRLEATHHIDEMLLEAGTIIGDDTQWPYRAVKDDNRIKRKVGDPLPPSINMTPMDEEARSAWRAKFGDEPVDRDPLKSVPLTGAPNAPMVRPPQAQPRAIPAQEPVHQKPAEAPKTGLNAPATSGGEKVNPPEPKAGASAPSQGVTETPKPTSTAPVGETPKA